MKSTLLIGSLGVGAMGLVTALGACFYEVGDLEPLGAGGSASGGSSSTSGGGDGGGKVGSSTSGTASPASSGSGGAGASSASSGAGGDGGSGGEAPLQFLSCRQDAAYNGVCGGDGGQVLVWLTEVPVEVQQACGDPQAVNPRCLVRHCAEESAGACADTAECGMSGVTHGLTCIDDPTDLVPPSAIYECSAQGPQCIGNIAVKPDPNDDKNCLFHDCAADGATCEVVAGVVGCASTP